MRLIDKLTDNFYLDQDRQNKDLLSLTLKARRDVEICNPLIQKQFDYYKNLPKIMNSAALIVFGALQKRKAPLIDIKNIQLIDMLKRSNTLDEVNMSYIKLPFDEFILCFDFDEIKCELCVYKIDNMPLPNGELDSYYMFDGYFQGNLNNEYVCGGINFSSKARSIDTDPNYKDLMVNIMNISQNIVSFMSIEQNISIINKELDKRKVKKYRNKRNQISAIPLFKDLKIEYSYKDEAATSGFAQHKKPHIVKGHFRKQPYKEDDEIVYKTIWIKPYYTGAVKDRANYNLDIKKVV